MDNPIPFDLEEAVLRRQREFAEIDRTVGIHYRPPHWFYMESGIVLAIVTLLVVQLVMGNWQAVGGLIRLFRHKKLASAWFVAGGIALALAPLLYAPGCIFQVRGFFKWATQTPR